MPPKREPIGQDFESLFEKEKAKAEKPPTAPKKRAETAVRDKQPPKPKAKLKPSEPVDGGTAPLKRQAWRPQHLHHTSVYIPREAWLELRKLSITLEEKDEKMNLNDLVIEGIELVLRKYGVADSIAELVEKKK